ncbi:MAG: ATP-binding cassette domain-containing protein [Thermoplasmataceae archaeon]
MIEVDLRKKLGVLDIRAYLNDSGLISVFGKNGSGKTSTLLMIAGFMRYDEGYVRINSRDITVLPPQKRSVIYLNQETYFPNLNVNAHIERGIRKSNGNYSGYVERIKSLLGIDFEGKMRNLSMGQRIRVSLATALINGPELIAVDESFSNLDDKETVLSWIKTYARQNRIDILFVTQDRSDLDTADHAYEMSLGKTEKIF